MKPLIGYSNSKMTSDWPLKDITDINAFVSGQGLISRRPAETLTLTLTLKNHVLCYLYIYDSGAYTWQ